MRFRSNRNAIYLFLIFSTLIISACSRNNAEFCSQADDYLTSSNFQGTVLVARGKKIIYSKGFGPEDEKSKASSENSSDTVYEIGSITKQMTAAAIMKQVEKGKLSLDDTLEKFFPEYVHGSKISVRMLLEMRSGLLDHINGPEEFFGNKLARQISKKELAGKTVGRDEVLNALYKAPLLTTPDSTYFYSNTNYYLLALILEQVTGMSYEDYMADFVFKPAGMTSSNTNFQNTTARGYVKNKCCSIPKGLALGCGDVNSTAEDLLKWNLAFTKGKIVSKKTFRQMTDSDSYGFGVYCTENSILHSGATHGFNSYNEYFLKDKVSFIILSNKPQSVLNTTAVAGKLKKMYFPAPKETKETKE
ncbi:MAG: beta-lactamase family protein [Treponema sp.]|nr:beta-lactamase family protein [Treponema sp.]